LILKGYNDYEQHHKVFENNFKKIEVPKELTIDAADINSDTHEMSVVGEDQKTVIEPSIIEGRKLKFWDRFKSDLIEIFSEDDDKLLK